MLEPSLNEAAVLYVSLCLKHKSNRCRPLLPHGARGLRGDSDDESNGGEIVSRHRTRASKVACRGCLEGGRSAIKGFFRYVTRFRFSTQKSNRLFDMQLHSLKQHWAGGSHLRKNKTGYHDRINSEEVTELIRELL
jgi:hypothetical protein